MIANNDPPSDNEEEITAQIGSKILKLLGQECMEHDLDLKSGARILIQVIDHIKTMDELFTALEKVKAQSEGDSNDN